MNFKVITCEKYLQYFLSDCEHNISDHTMTDFLNDMISVSESIEMTVPPTEIIKEVMGKCGLEGNPYDGITLIANSDLVETLNVLEVFTLLWFVSCKNAFTYEEGIYIKYCNNGIIGKLLKRLTELCK